MPFTLSQNLDALAQAVRALDHPRLVFLDPLPSLLAPVTEFSEPDPRPLLKSKPDGVVTLLNTIARIAKTYNVAILAITHCTKSAQPAIHRARGSIAVTAAARSVLLLTDHPLDPQTRVLHTIKSLYGPPPDPIAFTITAKPGAPAPRLDWTSDPIGSPILLPGSLSPSSLRRSVASSHSSLTEAADWLTHALSAGPKLARDLIAEARLDGISLGSLRRAKSILAVQSANSTPGWIWSLP